MQRVLVILAVLVLALGQATGSLQVTPSAPVLFAFSNYTVSYYTIYAMPSSASFKLDFSQTYILVPNATLNLTASVSSSVVSGATGSCLSNVCTLKLNNAVPIYSNMSFTIGLLQNPYFLMNQTISTKVTFNSSYSENLTWTIAQSYYTPMAITLNSISQSNYGVGNPNVNYTFNLSLPMTPANPQLTLTIPAQVGASNLQTALTFYNA